MTRDRSVLFAIATLFLAAACSTPRTNPHLALRYEKGWEKTELDSLIARAGKGDVEVVKLGNTAWVSHHVAIVRTEEKPHYHRFHDLTVTVLRGEGILSVDQSRVAMKAGDVAHVHRGTPHFFRNGGSDPAVAFVVFSPPFDGRDTVTAEPDKKKGKGKDEAADDEEAPPAKKPWWKPW